MAIRSSVNVRGFRNGKSTVETVAFVRPAARTNTVDFLETVAASPNDPWTKATRAAALIDCKNGILLVGTNGFASLDVLRKRWFDPDDGRRLLLVNYEAPNDPTLFPNQSFSRPDGPTLRVTVAKDPRTTLGVSFGAASTVPVLGAIARELNGTISFVPCRGTLVSLASDDLSGAELAAIANLIKIAFPVGTVPAFEYGQVDDPCPVWRK